MSIDDERDLHERLEAAFEAISPHPAPIDDAIRRGRGIRIWRRAAVAAAVAVVAAAAFSVPALLHRTAAPAPAAPRQPYTVTVQAPGPGAQPDAIAYGTINGQRWFIIADQPGVDGASSSQQIIIVAGPGVGAPAGSELYIPTLGTETATGPVFFNSSTFGTADQVQVGAVAADVSYVTVRLGNGAVLVLRPVTVYGTRAVALALPMRAEITEVAAYSRHGEIAFAVPFNWPGGGAWVISWLRPGQVPAPQVSGVIGSGSVHGKAWSATAYLGPWGTCIVLDGASPQGGGLCVPALSGVTAVDSLDPGGTPEVAGGVMPTAATRVAVTEPDGTTVQVRPVTVGSQKLFAVALRPGTKPLRWTAYDSAGRAVASSGR